MVATMMESGEKFSSSEIPNKLYFRIGEVSDLVGVKPYVLRYWESEFTDIKPSKSKSGQRLYKRRDVELLMRIRGLLYEERFTINGARRRLREWSKPAGANVESTLVTTPKQMQAQPQVALPTEKPTVVTAKKVDDSKQEERIAQKPQPLENRKLLLKVRKDLDDMLKILRS